MSKNRKTAAAGINQLLFFMIFSWGNNRPPSFHLFLLYSVTNDRKDNNFLTAGTLHRQT